LLIGGNGRRLLTMAAQEADIVGLTGITFRPGGQGPELSGLDRCRRGGTAAAYPRHGWRAL